MSSMLGTHRPVERHRRPLDPVLVAGRWGESLSSEDAATHGVVLRFCRPDASACLAAIRTGAPRWLVIAAAGGGPEAARIMAVVQDHAPTLPVAVVAAEGVGEPARWLRRGCTAFLTRDVDPVRTIAILRFVEACDVVVVDRAHTAPDTASTYGPDPCLTMRESEIVDLLRQGLRNREIAAHLGIEGTTVDFHVRNVLGKLGARNRIEAVLRADRWGL